MDWHSDVCVVYPPPYPEPSLEQKSDKRKIWGAMRIAKTILVVLILLCMVGSMFSGIILSRHVFTFITVKGWHSFARNLHMISAYWGLVLMSVHWGFHWNIILKLAGKACKKPSAVRKWIFRAAAVFIAGYGIYAFFDREIGRYMLLINHFVFFDYDEPMMSLLMDYAAVMGLFVFVGYYFLKGIKYTVRTHGN